MNVKMIVRAKDYSWYPSSCICENGKVSKNIANTLVSVCDEIINVTDIACDKYDK